MSFLDLLGRMGVWSEGGNGRKIRKGKERMRGI